MEQKTFRELYMAEREKDKAPTNAQRFVRRVATLTRKSELTVKAWIAGVQKPGELEKALIAEEYGVDMGGLFPEPNKYERKPAEVNQ